MRKFGMIAAFGTNLLLMIAAFSLLFHPTQVESSSMAGVESTSFRGKGFVTSSNTVLSDEELASLPLQKAYNRIAKMNMDAVVNLYVEKSVSIQARRGSPFSFDDEFFKRFFGLPDVPPEKQKSVGYGSGFLINEDGYLISNNHVVADAELVLVSFQGSEKKYKAEIVGTDPNTDIALLKLLEGNRKKLPHVILGDSEKLNVGDIVVAIGNPFGLSHTFTTGVVSAKDRANDSFRSPSDQMGFQRLIQTDVAINPGNSGGPLINIRGEVVGINCMIYSDGGGSIGIGFAIPINTVKKIISQLRTKGFVRKTYLGISMDVVPEELAEELSLKDGRGVYISTVEAGSPAKKSGLEAGDIFLQINEKIIQKTTDVSEAITEKEPGTVIKIRILRPTLKKEMVISVKLEEHPLSSQKPVTNKNSTKPNKTIGDITVRDQDSTDGPTGVVVTGIRAGSPLLHQGLAVGDVIIRVNYKEVKTIKQLEDLLSSVKKFQKIILHVQDKRGILKIISIENFGK